MDISVFTLGCKTNLYESGQIITQLQKRGHNAFYGLKRADVFVLNTCAITAEAEKKSRQLVARAKKLNPNCRVIVVGCAAEKNSAQFEKIKNVTLIKGVAGKQNVADQILQSGIDIETVPSVYVDSVNSSQERTRAFIKIQDGCNNFCSYCIVPYLRGRSRSRKISDVVAEVKSAGAAETVLIGIDISQFGKDNGETLADLFYALQGTDTRFRLGSLEAGVVCDKLLESLTKVNFCPHFHLSLQSGSDTVLKRMNRKYTTMQYAQAVKNIRKVWQNAAITTDIIVGFCGETDDEFLQTARFAQQIGFADIHVFPYSPREGTVAYGCDDVPTAIKSSREQHLLQIKQNLRLQFAKEHLGKTAEVLCEQKHNGKWEGYTDDYLRVSFDGNCETGQIVKVKIVDFDQKLAQGEIVL